MSKVIIWFCLFIHGCSKPIPDGNDEDINKYSMVNKNIKCNDCIDTEDETTMIESNNNIESERDDVHDSTANKNDCYNLEDCPHHDDTDVKRSDISLDKSDILHCKHSDTHSTATCCPSINLPKESCYPNMPKSDDVDCNTARPEKSTSDSILDTLEKSTFTQSESQNSVASVITLCNATSEKPTNSDNSTSEKPDNSDNSTIQGTAKSVCTAEPVTTPITTPCVTTPIAPVAASIAPALPPIAPALPPIAPALPPIAPALPPIAPATPPSTPVTAPNTPSNPYVATCATPPIATSIAPCSSTPQAIYTPSITPYSLSYSPQSNIAYSAACNVPAYQTARINSPSIVSPIASCHTLTQTPCATAAPNYYVPPVSTSCTTLPTAHYATQLPNYYVPPVSTPCATLPTAHYATQLATPYTAPCTTALSPPLSPSFGIPSIAHYIPQANPPCAPRFETPSISPQTTPSTTPPCYANNFVFNFNNGSNVPDNAQSSKSLCPSDNAQATKSSCPSDNEESSKASNISSATSYSTHDYTPLVCNKSIDYGSEHYEPEPEENENHDDEDTSHNKAYHVDTKYKSNDYHHGNIHFDDDKTSSKSDDANIDSIIHDCGDMPVSQLRPYIIGSSSDSDKDSNSKVNHQGYAAQDKDGKDSNTHYNKVHTYGDESNDRSYSENKDNVKDTSCDSHDCGSENPNLSCILFDKQNDEDMPSHKHNAEDMPSSQKHNAEDVPLQKHNAEDTSSNKMNDPSLNDIFDGCSKKHNDETKPCNSCDNTNNENDNMNKGRTICSENKASDQLNIHDFIDEENSGGSPCSEFKICNPPCAENSPSEKPNLHHMLDEDESSKLPCDENTICNPPCAENTPSAEPCTEPCDTPLYHQHEHTHEHHHDDSSTTYVHEHHHHHHHHHEHDHIHHQCYPSCFCQSQNNEGSNDVECGTTRTPDNNSENNTQSSKNNTQNSGHITQTSGNNTQTVGSSVNSTNVNKSTVLCSSIDQICDFLTTSSNNNKVIADKRNCICCCNHRSKGRDCICKVVDCSRKNDIKIDIQNDNNPRTKRHCCLGSCQCHHHHHQFSHHHHHHHQHNCYHHHRHHYHHHHHNHHDHNHAYEHHRS